MMVSGDMSRGGPSDDRESEDERIALVTIQQPCTTEVVCCQHDTELPVRVAEPDALTDFMLANERHMHTFDLIFKLLIILVCVMR